MCMNGMVKNYVIRHGQLRSARENTGNLKMQFEWVPCVMKKSRFVFILPFSRSGILVSFFSCVRESGNFFKSRGKLYFQVDISDVLTTMSAECPENINECPAKYRGMSHTLSIGIASHFYKLNRLKGAQRNNDQSANCRVIF